MEVKPEYQQTEVGLIPLDWSLKRLQSLNTQPATYGVVKAGVFQQKGIPMLRGGDIKEGRVNHDLPLISEEKNAEYSRTVLRENDVVIALVGYPGEAAVIPDALVGGNISRAVGLLRPGSLLSSKYLACYLNSPSGRTEFLKPGAGSAQMVVNLRDLNLLLVPLPPTKAEQEAIAETLSDADALIESLEQLIAKKHNVKQGAMQELLTGKKHLPGVSGEWSKVRMREVLLQPATYGIVKAGAFIQNGIKMLRGGDIIDGRVNTELPMVSHEKAAEYSRTTLAKDDVVIALVGYPGASAQIPNELIGANISRAVGLLRLNKKIAPAYLVCFLNSPIGRRMVLAPSAGSAQQVVNLTALNKLEFHLPELDEQTAIATILNDMDAEIAALEAKLVKAKQIKQGMMQELLTGRIRLV